MREPAEIIHARLGGSDMIMIAGYMNTMPCSIVPDKNIVKVGATRVH
jgi:hypothetical protein